MEDFITNRNATDFSLGVGWFNVGVDPTASVANICEVRDFATRDPDGNGNAGVGQCAENFWVDVKDFDAVNEGFVFEELGHLGWGREVVAEGTVGDADEIGGGQGLE